MAGVLEKLFGNVQVNSILDKILLKQDFSLPPDATVKDAVKFLTSKTDLFAAPVIENGKCIGLVGMLDIAAYVINAVPNIEFLEAGQLRTMVIAGREIGSESIRNVINMSGRDPLITVNVNANLLEVCRILADGLHTIPVIGNDNKCVGIIDHLNIINLLKEYTGGGKGQEGLSKGEIREGGQKAKSEGESSGLKKGLDLSNVFGKRLAEYKLGRTGVVCVSSEKKAIEAVNSLWKNKVSGVAVIDQNGRLMGNFSSFDLKGMILESWADLLLPVEEYLLKYSPNSLSPVCARYDTTLVDLVNELTTSHIYRLWCIDGDFRPNGVVSTTDLLKGLLEMRS